MKYPLFLSHSAFENTLLVLYEITVNILTSSRVVLGVYTIIYLMYLKIIIEKKYVLNKNGAVHIFETRAKDAWIHCFVK